MHTLFVYVYCKVSIYSFTCHPSLKIHLISPSGPWYSIRQYTSCSLLFPSCFPCVHPSSTYLSLHPFFHPSNRPSIIKPSLYWGRFNPRHSFLCSKQTTELSRESFIGGLFQQPAKSDLHSCMHSFLTYNSNLNTWQGAELKGGGVIGGLPIVTCSLG